MEGRIRLWSFILVAAFGLTAGCGNDDKSPSSAGAASGDGSDAGGGTGGANKRLRGDTADAAVLTVIDGLKENRLDAFWDFLPAGYQKDLNDLVHSFAKRMDAELWNKSVDVLRKLARMLKEKKEFLAAARARARQEPGAAPGPSPAELGAIADLLETLLASDLADLEKLDPESYGRLRETMNILETHYRDMCDIEFTIEKRRLWIPEDLAYQGKPDRPKGMLVFDIELLKIN
jgi:AcrR family transcriptional regulator